MIEGLLGLEVWFTNNRETVEKFEVIKGYHSSLATLDTSLPFSDSVHDSHRNRDANKSNSSKWKYTSREWKKKNRIQRKK